MYMIGKDGGKKGKQENRNECGKENYREEREGGSDGGIE